MLISGEGKGGASQLGLPAFCCVDSVIQWYKNFSLEYPRIIIIIPPKLHWNLRYVLEISSRHSTKII
jgi:hypothetical protein